ncbi:J domain-containing protein [Pseudarthrobacter sp. MM222]|uniref:J domain-containing protein n=1 Tax=Pseudarthrobacter sp. MM222 TaxID=3018929 RepID=UPI002220A630|nr:DnaJ domain-containing protein [Pseudarthrobacter sp. MM222]CAI3803321.1 Chaperone protein DnaJ [Pseudarthrobacter sp. MM222]
MNADPRGYYAALHLTPAATQADIQRAFRALIRLHHPDVGPTGPGEEGRGADVGNILAAFGVLRNPLTRAEYDRNGQAPGAGAGSGPTAAAPRDIPVRHHGGRGPALRITPVRWERGPWEGRS